MVIIASAALLVSCWPSHANRIVVGSKNFTESFILGELIAQQIEAHTSLKAERRFYLAGTYICHQEILSGRIDIYPEYTGTALTAILKEKPSSDHQEVYERVRQEYARRFRLAVTEPLGFDNTFTMVIRGDDARRLNLRTISQASKYAPQWRAGFGYEFMERPDRYEGLARAYGLRFAAPPRIMDLGLLYRALKEKEVDIVAGSATDGLISALGFVVLEDDRHYFPPYDAVPIMREHVLQQHPEVGTTLAALAGRITAEDMRRMNYAVDGAHRDAKQVVAEFLRAKGL